MGWEIFPMIWIPVIKKVEKYCDRKNPLTCFGREIPEITPRWKQRSSIINSSVENEVEKSVRVLI